MSLPRSTAPCFAALTLALVCGAASAREAAPIRVLVLEPERNDVDAAVPRAVEDLVTVQLSDRGGLDVMSRSDIANLANLEAEKSAAGCDATSGACLAEIAGALGADFVVFGRATRLGALIVVTLNTLDARAGKTLLRVSAQARDLSELPQQLREPTNRIYDAIRKARPGSDAPAAVAASVAAPPAEQRTAPASSSPAAAVGHRPSEGPTGAETTMWSMIGVGSAAALVGVGVDLFSPTTYNNTIDVVDVVGPTLCVLGGGAIVAGIIVGSLPPEEPPAVASTGGVR